MSPSTEFRAARLATQRALTIPEHPRLVRRRRLAAFVELFNDAPRKPDALYELQRAEPRVKGLPDDRQREIIHDGIRAALISRERIIRYRAQQLLDDFRQFPDEASATDVTYTRLMLEEAEAIEAQTIAHALPTPSNIDAAIRETRELVAVAELECRILELYPLTHVIPMGRNGR